MDDRPTFTAVERTPPPSPSSREDDVDELLSSPPPVQPKPPKRKRTTSAKPKLKTNVNQATVDQQPRKPSAKPKVPVRAASSRFPTPPTDQDAPAGAKKKAKVDREHPVVDARVGYREKTLPATAGPARAAAAPPSSPELPLILGLARYASPELFGSQPDHPVASTSTSITAVQRSPRQHRVTVGQGDELAVDDSSETTLDADPPAPRRLVHLPAHNSHKSPNFPSSSKPDPFSSHQHRPPSSFSGPFPFAASQSPPHHTNAHPSDRFAPAARGAYISLSPAGFSNALQSWMGNTADERDAAVSRATRLDATVRERDRVIGSLAAELKDVKGEREMLKAENESLRDERDQGARRIDALGEVRRGLLGQLDEARKELNEHRGEAASG